MRLAIRHKMKQLWGQKKARVAIMTGTILVAGAATYFSMTGSSTELISTTYMTTTVTEGTLASSKLLSGQVKAVSEQYVYFDASKGGSAYPTVAVGNEVYVGQQLVQYSTTEAQANYDEAVRNLNKVGREINHLTTYGVTQTPVMESGLGDGAVDDVSNQVNADYATQLQNLYDAYATAEAQVAKAQAALNETVVVSNVNGTVVAVEQNIDPGSKESQVLVHVTSEGRLQVVGDLTEYDLANIKEGQSVKIKSKVYPDEVWNGTITSISNYPNKESSANSGSTGTGASYPFKAEIISDIGDLKQGFSVSVEVVNDQKGIIVPISAVVTEGEKSYVWTFDQSSKKIKKVEVVLGSADALNQEITEGLRVNQVIITTPDASFEEGQVLEDVEEMPKTEEMTSE